MYKNIIGFYSQLKKNQNELLREEYLLREERTKTLWYVHKMEYYTAMKMNELLLGPSI